MGALMRRYWIPAFFSRDLPASQPLRGKLLGENLVAFRDAGGRVGLIDERCAHRRASLFFGRKEADGLRCTFHGWKFDTEGRCIDRPVPEDGEACGDEAVVKAYPCIERAGLIWTYMGEAGAQPRFPRLEWMLVPEEHRVASRELRKVNWLHALEQDPGAPDAPPLLTPPFHTMVKRGALPDSASRANAWVPVDDRHVMVYTVHYSTARAVLADDAAPVPAADAAAHTGIRADVRSCLLDLLDGIDGEEMADNVLEPLLSSRIPAASVAAG